MTCMQRERTAAGGGGTAGAVLQRWLAQRRAQRAFEKAMRRGAPRCIPARGRRPRTSQQNQSQPLSRNCSS